MQAHVLPPQVRRDFIEDAAPLDGRVIAYPTFGFTVECVFQLSVVVDPSDLIRIALPDLERRAAGKRGMRSIVVFRLDVGPKPQVELIDARDTLQIQPLDQLSSERAPEPLDFPLRRSVARTAVHQMDGQTRTQQP